MIGNNSPVSSRPDPTKTLSRIPGADQLVHGSTSIPDDFATKAKINAHFVLAAIRGFLSSTKGIPWYKRILAFQPANQLIVEGLELVLKAMLLKRGKNPPRKHELKLIYTQLPPSDRSVVDDVVCDAIERSATGEISFGLPNVSGVTLRKPLRIGVDEAEEDHTGSYADMDALAFFEMLDTEWGTDSSQYVGVTSRFDVDKQTLRVNTRVLAGAILVCITLADSILEKE